MNETVLISDYVTVVQSGTIFEVFAYTRIDRKLYQVLLEKPNDWFLNITLILGILRPTPVVSPTTPEPETLTANQLPPLTIPTSQPPTAEPPPAPDKSCHLSKSPPPNLTNYNTPPSPHTGNLHNLHTYILFHHPCDVLYNNQIIHSIILSEYQFGIK